MPQCALEVNGRKVCEAFYSNDPEYADPGETMCEYHRGTRKVHPDIARWKTRH